MRGEHGAFVRTPRGLRGEEARALDLDEGKGRFLVGDPPPLHLFALVLLSVCLFKCDDESDDLVAAGVPNTSSSLISTFCRIEIDEEGLFTRIRA